MNSTVYLLRSAPHFKHPPKTPPKPLWRPTDPPAVVAEDVLSDYERLLDVIEAQTGAPRGIAPAEEVSNGR